MSSERPHSAPQLRAPTVTDLIESVRLGAKDFVATPGVVLFSASFYGFAGIFMAALTIATGTINWPIFVVMGFSIVESLAAHDFYETSRRLADGGKTHLKEITLTVQAQRFWQLSRLAAIIVVVFLFWFFLGRMIIGLFLGLSPMINVLSTLDVFLSTNGLMLPGLGTAVGSVFAVVVFGMSVLGMPM